MTAGLTLALAEQGASLDWDDLPDDVVELARQCLLDWLAVTLAGSSEPAARIALSVTLEDEPGTVGATVVGTHVRLTAPAAALVNGTASHALDYDDANTSMVGHPTVPLLGALLPVAEKRHSSGAELLTAFVAGYETECRLGRAVGLPHYRQGFHATGTIGAIGAAAACARLLGLDAYSTAAALGLAATQAGGLKCMFGTMAKPLHAGRAAANGLLAARLAVAGFTANAQALEASQGFIEALGGSPDGEELSAIREGWFIRRNLFKFHASCLETHSVIEGIQQLRAAHPLPVEAISRIVIHANSLQLGMCAIPDPATGLEAKFSLRHLAAAAALGIDTSAVACFSDDFACDSRLAEVRGRVEVVDDGPASGGTPVDIWLTDDRRLNVTYDTHGPATDLAAQRRRLEDKAMALATPVIGDRSGQLVDAAAHISDSIDVRDLIALTATSEVEGQHD
ncbi:MAG: MmgE/PrpD family protein [Acidimicrobiales bacterium]|nr:MmgE/PrpD family protein [Acidimicrobiales bacterium]